MANILMYNPSAVVPNQAVSYTTGINTPDYLSVPNSIINPDLSALLSVPMNYWKVSSTFPKTFKNITVQGGTVVEMSPTEKSTVDNSLLPGIKTTRKTYLLSAMNAFLDSLGYNTDIRQNFLTMYSDALRYRPNRGAYLQPFISWIHDTDVELSSEYAAVDAQTTITGVNAININTTSLAASNPNVTLGAALAITDTLDVSSFVDANSVVTDPETGLKGPFYLMQELQHRKDLYNDSENPIYFASHTPILGNNGILQDHANRVLNLELIHEKEGWHEQQVLGSQYSGPKDLLIYYGYLNSFNSAANGFNNENVAQDIAKYAVIAIGDGIEVPTHPDYANTQIILPRLKVLNPDILIFGYVAVAQTLAAFKTKVDQWNTLGVQGIFMDEAGYDFGTNREGFNVCVDYIHGKSVSNLCFANAWNTDHILGTANDVSFPNSTYNPGLVASNLTSNDWILLESFPINTTAYSSSAGYELKTDWLIRGNKIISLRATYGVNFAGSGIINNANANGASLFNFGYISALMFALEAFGTSDDSYASSSAAVTYWIRQSTEDMGMIYEQYPSVNVSNSDADVYLRYVDSAVMSLDFSTSAQLSNINRLNVENGGSKLVVPCQTVLISNLGPGNAGFLLITNTGYFVYLGKILNPIIVKYVEFHVSTAGAGTQTAEVGLFSSPAFPNKANQVMTKIVSTGTMTSLTTTGVKRNTTAFTNTIASGTHLWAGIRTAMVTTQPTIWGIGTDMAQGQILSTATPGVLTGAGPWTGAIITAATGVCCPDLRGVLN